MLLYDYEKLNSVFVVKKIFITKQGLKKFLTFRNACLN